MGFSIDDQWSASAGLKVQWRGDRSRFAVLAEPIGSGSRNPGDPRLYLQCKAGDRASVATDQRGPRTRHTFSSFETRRPPLCRSTTHGYVRLFRYADDPAERATGTRNIPRGSRGRMDGEICSNMGNLFLSEQRNNFLNFNSLNTLPKLAQSVVER